MSDISEPQDLEKAHVSAWFTLSKHFELHEAGYVLPRNYSFTRLSFQNILFSAILAKCFGRYSFS